MPLFSDTLRNTNTEAPCLNVNDLQVKGFGIFPDTAARDALNVTIRTEGYLACMNDSDKVYIYTSSSTADVDWTNTANWQLTGVDSFTGLTDTPISYPLGSSGQSVIVNGNEDGLEFGSPSGVTSYRAKMTGNTGTLSRMVKVSGYDSVLDLPEVATASVNPGKEGELVVGMVASASPGDIVDVLVEGKVFISWITPSGVVPEYGEYLYGLTGVAYLASGLGTEGFACGRVLDYTFVSSFSSGDIYEGSILLKMPNHTAYFKDSVPYIESQRLAVFETAPSPDVANIVKYASTSSSSQSPRVTQWNPANGDTVLDIAGITAEKPEIQATSGNESSLCLRGVVLFQASLIGGAPHAGGELVYSDATSPWLLTTDPTSGIQVGIIQSAFTYLEVDYVQIDVDPLRSAGGATTGEKLDFTVRTDAYTGATGEHEGIDLKLGGAASVTVGLSYYWNGNWNASDAVLPASGDGLMAMATDTGVGVNMMQKGIIQLAANPTGAVAGSVLYFESGTPGTLTATAPSASGNIVRVAGHAIDAAGLVYFDPSEDWLEII